MTTCNICYEEFIIGAEKNTIEYAGSDLDIDIALKC